MAGLPAIKKTIDNPAVFESIKKRLGDESRTRSFLASVLELCNSDNSLAKCNPNDILREALKAELLGLSLNKQIGQAYIVPYKNIPTFIPGWRAYKKFAHNTKQISKSNEGYIYKGQEVTIDYVTGDIDIKGKPDLDEKGEPIEVIGYIVYAETTYGYKKALYWSKEKGRRHGKKYAPSNPTWKKEEDKMILKSLIKELYSKHIPIAAEACQDLFKADLESNKFDESEEPDFSDANTGEIIDIEEEKQELEFEEKADVDKKEAKDESFAFAEPEY
jgi:recombination protein RecT